jgi:rhodanese-related sulfurtransferase
LQRGKFAASCLFVSERRTIHDLLEEARHRLRRLTPAEALDALRAGAVLVDTRSEEQRRSQGTIPGSRHHPLSVLEWRLDPTAPSPDPDVSLEDWIVVLCAEGYSSSLAAERLQQLGFARATDVIGGVAGWREAGLPLLTG